MHREQLWRIPAFVHRFGSTRSAHSRTVCKAIVLLLVSLHVTGLVAAPNAAAQSRYDPRTWHFDTDTRTLMRRSDPETTFAQKSVVPPKVVPFEEKLAAGAIVVETGERRLYFVLGGGKAIRYQVGVGREGFQWSGRDHITAKREWPDWRPPADMIRREAKLGRHLPVYVEGGPNNPLGARALYIGHTLYRIHGTNQPSTIGQATSSGCIRMTNEDVIDLYGRVTPGAQVIVRH